MSTFFLLWVSLWVNYFHPQLLKERIRRPTTAVLISTGKPKANRSTPIIRQQAGRAGGGKAGRLLAPFPSANLLPVAKFVSNGFLINQLGQVDLRLSPQNTRLPAFPPPALPACCRPPAYIFAFYVSNLLHKIERTQSKGGQGSV